MAGLVPGIHVFLLVVVKTWMPATSPAKARRPLDRFRGHDGAKPDAHKQ